MRGESAAGFTARATPSGGKIFSAVRQSATFASGKKNVQSVQASVSQRGNRVILTDYGTRAGVYVNGHRVKKEVPLLDGDEITLGSVVLRLHIKGGTAANVRREGFEKEVPRPDFADEFYLGGAGESGVPEPIEEEVYEEQAYSEEEYYEEEYGEEVPLEEDPLAYLYGDHEEEAEAESGEMWEDGGYEQRRAQRFAAPYDEVEEYEEEQEEGEPYGEEEYEEYGEEEYGEEGEYEEEDAFDDTPETRRGFFGRRGGR